MQSAKQIKHIIKTLDLTPHIEGGFYKRYYESENYIIKDNNRKCRAGSAIYYLLTKYDISKFHSISSDELWNFYEGGVLEIHEITKDNEYKIHYLGNYLKYDYASFAIIIKKGSIFAARVYEGEYVLSGCSLHPEFIFQDFTIYEYDELKIKYPMYNEKITAFQNNQKI